MDHGSQTTDDHQSRRQPGLHAPPDLEAPEATDGPRAFGTTSLGWITFLGGPLAGALGLAYNARAFEDTRQARLAVILGVVGMAVFMGVLFQLPDAIVNNVLFTAAAAGVGLAVIASITEALQGEQIRAHKASGRRAASGWLGAGLVLLSWVGIFLISLAFTLATPPFEGTPYERAGGGTMYAIGDATEADVRRVGTALQRFGYFPGGIAAQVDRRPDSVRVSMLLIPEVEADTAFLQNVHLLSFDLERTLRTRVAIVNVVDGFSGRRETVLTNILSREERPSLTEPPSPAPPAPPPSPAPTAA